MSVQLASQDFATPDKGGPNNMTVSTVDGNDYQQQQKAAPATASNAPDAQTSTSMTPMEAGQKDSNNKNSNQRLNAVTPHGSHPGTSGKQVRFGADETSHGKPLSSESLATAVSNNRSGVPVSRRGGRFVSPARSMVANTSTPASSSDGESKAAASEMTPKEHSVLEYQTFQNDSTPSLRSTNSVGLVSMPSESEKETDGKVKSEGELVVDSRRPTSISYGSSNVQASPLTKTSPQKDCPSFDDEAKSLIRSPVPSQSYDRVSPEISAAVAHSIA